MQTVIPNEEAAHSFKYSLGDETTVMADDQGNYVAYAFTDDNNFSQYEIDDPWARDAIGNPVKTNFEINGQGDLIQVVQPDANTKYPIVADPRWKWLGLGYGAKMNKYETRRIADGGTAAGLCVLLGGAVAGSLCAAMASHVVQTAKNAVASGKCVFVQTVPMPMGIQYKDGDCF